MKTFKEYLNEMPRQTGQLGRKDHSLENDWKNFFVSSKHTKLIKDKITSKNYKLFNSHNFYFLVDKDDNYIASIEGRKEGDMLLINTGQSNIRGHYKILVYEILANLNFKYIFSGDTTSSDAYKFWIKLMEANDPRAKPVVKIFSEISPYDKNTTYPSNARFGISNDNSLKEHLTELDKTLVTEYDKEFRTEYPKRYGMMIRYK